MCLHDIIVVYDCNSGAQRQAETARQDIPVTCVVCVYCSLFPVFLATPSCSVYSAMYCVARQGSTV